MQLLACKFICNDVLAQIFLKKISKKGFGVPAANKPGNLANLVSAFRRLKNLPNLKAVVITKPGAPEVLQLQDRTVPEPAPGEVLVKVFAAGVNRPDVAQRKGHYPPPPGASLDIPGLEISGIVERLGKDSSIVEGWRQNMRACKWQRVRRILLCS